MAVAESCRSTWPRSRSHSQAEVRGTLAICETMSRTPPDVPASKSRQLPMSNIRQKLPRRPQRHSRRVRTWGCPSNSRATVCARVGQSGITGHSGVGCNFRTSISHVSTLLDLNQSFMDTISGADSGPFPVGLLPVLEDLGEGQHGCNDTGAHSAVPECPNMVVNHCRIPAYVSWLLCAMYTQGVWGVKDGVRSAVTATLIASPEMFRASGGEGSGGGRGSVGSATGSLVVGSEDSISEWAE